MSGDRTWVIGGGPNCDLIVDRPAVSGIHCRLSLAGAACTVEDLGSTNGTFVNGESIVGLMAITPADDVRLGRAVPMPWPPGLVVGGLRVLRVGRTEDNDIVIDAPMVSGEHARVILGGGTAIIEDLGSANGTSLNEPGHPIDRSPLGPTDVVYFGSYKVPAGRLLDTSRPARPAQSARTTGAAVAFRGLEMTFGRDPQCDQPLNYPMISWRHARLFRAGDSVFAEDLHSANGTYLNGRRIGRPAAIGPGDVLSLGSYSITLGEGGELCRRDMRGAITIEARDLGVAVHGRWLLEGASITIRPGEFVGLMGPSGAGKSTLMKALNGYIRPSAGSVRYNGLELTEHFDRFRGYVGYVPQEDIIHRELTVGQALRLSARLRLPADYSKIEIDHHVQEILSSLGLAGTEDVPIGTPAGNGVSGGQRKRVNLAMELITDPSILFLDEPTSGLSSEDTLAVMRLLRELADAGKTILLTIHQPSLEAYRLMDRLAVVAREPGRAEAGRLIYSGRGYPDALDFFRDEATPDRPGTGPIPEDVLRGLPRRTPAEWAARFAALPTTGLDAGTAPAENGEPLPPPRVAGGLGLRQWPTLVRRTLAIKARDTANSAILLAQAPIIAALVVMVFGKATTAAPTPETWPDYANGVNSTVFVLGLAAIWFGCSNAVREVVGEWPVYHRERMVNLKLAPYVGSKLAVLGVVCMFQCAVLLAIVRWGTGLKGPLWAMFGLLSLASAVGLVLGLLISALARTSEAAIALLPLVILPMLILGGALQPLAKMNPALRLTAGALPSRWAFEGLLLTESEARSRRFETSPESSREPDLAETPFPSSDRMGPGASTLALAFMLVGGAGGVLAALRARDAY
jgi:ABC-type multidrug transport system ATPase subunit/pSer/pThr/pTyr-binding forkhead associated (FHA) protein